MADGLEMENTTAETQTAENEIEVKLSQDKLNKLINEKYAKGAEKAKAELLESLGVDSVDSLRNVLSKYKELEDSQKSEAQKLAEAIEAKDKELNEVKSLLDTTKTKAEINSIASKFGFVDEDFLEFEYKKAKAVEDFELDKWIENLKESKPYLFKTDTKPVLKTDMSANKAQTQSLSERIKNAKSQKELDVIYKELKLK